jgi:hypothetical protein
MMTDDDSCDYCRDKGWYLMDGKKETCFCVGEKRVAITDKELKRLLRDADIDASLTVRPDDVIADRVFAFNADGEHEYMVADAYGGVERFAIAKLLALAPDMARELLAARKVVRLLSKARAGDSISKAAVDKAIDAYDKARNGKVTT